MPARNRQGNIRKPVDRRMLVAGIVSTWTPGDVPDPNPLFPPPPRQGPRGASFVFAAAVVALIACVAFLLYAAIEIPEPGFNILFLPVVGATAATGLAAFLYPVHQLSRAWRCGAALPARVTDVKTGFLEGFGVDIEALRVIGLVASVLGGPIGSALAIGLIVLGMTRFEVQWIEGGKLRHTQVAGFMGAGLEVGQPIWILKLPTGKPLAAMFAASWHQQVHNVPPEVVAWLDAALRRAGGWLPPEPEPSYLLYEGGDPDPRYRLEQD